jgi:serine/threonine-protein kinase
MQFVVALALVFVFFAYRSSVVEAPGIGRAQVPKESNDQELQKRSKQLQPGAVATVLSPGRVLVTGGGPSPEAVPFPLVESQQSRQQPPLTNLARTPVARKPLRQSASGPAIAQALGASVLGTELPIVDEVGPVVEVAGTDKDMVPSFPNVLPQLYSSMFTAVLKSPSLLEPVTGTRTSYKVARYVLRGAASRAEKPLHEGMVEFRMRPYAIVWLEGTRLDMTPFAPVKIPAGRYRVDLFNPDLGKMVTMHINVHAGEHRVLIFNFLEDSVFPGGNG